MHRQPGEPDGIGLDVRDYRFPVLEGTATPTTPQHTCSSSVGEPAGGLGRDPRRRLQLLAGRPVSGQRRPMVDVRFGTEVAD